MIKECFLNKRQAFRRPLHPVRNSLENQQVAQQLVEARELLKIPQVKVQDVNGNQHVLIRLREICVYPIKSCGAFKVARWPLTSRGLKWDREWLIVRENGVAMTQKQDTRLCMIKPRITDSELILSYPGVESIAVPLNMELNGTSSSISMCQSKVCNDNVDGDDCGNEVAEWISNVMNTPGLRLIRQNFRRKRYTKETNKEVALANKSQFLVLNRTSVKWLANQVDDWYQDGFDLEAIIDRFRGNLIVEMDPHLAENQVTALSSDGVKLERDGMCTRCQMICIDQNSGEKTAEPLRTLIRSLEGKMRFGVYFSQVSNGGFLDCSKQMTANLE